MRLWALASNTFREAVRDRVLYSILFFAVGVLLLSLVMDEITIGDQDKVVRSVAQGAISLFSSIIAIFLGVSLVWKEIERKTVYTILSKPIPRWMFLLGKYLGLVATLAVEIAILLVVYVAIITAHQGFPPAVVFASVGLLLFELMLLTAWATLFSTYSAPMTASFFTLAIFVIGHLADEIWLFGSQAASESLRNSAQILYWLLPNFELFNIRAEAVHALAVPTSRCLGAVVYGLGYSAVVLGVAMWSFSRRDLR